MAVYTEDTLVQQTTADYLRDELGWQSVYAFDTENFGPGRINYRTLPAKSGAEIHYRLFYRP